MPIIETNELTKIYTLGRGKEVVGLNKVNFDTIENHWTIDKGK